MLRRSAFAGATLHHHFPPAPIAIKFLHFTPSRPVHNFAATSASSPLRSRIAVFRSLSASRQMPTRCCSSKSADEGGRSGVKARESTRERNIQHLLVKETDTALVVQLLQRLNTGEDFDELVLQYSICPSKTDSGIIGWVTKDQLEPEFAKVAFEAPLERIVRCKTRLGWHLLRVLGERDAPVKDITPAELHQKIQDPLFYEEAQLIDVREPDEVSQASLPGFQVFPLRQFGNWGPDITTKLDISKDTYVLSNGMAKLVDILVEYETIETYVIMEFAHYKLPNGYNYRGSKAFTMLLEGYMPMPKMWTHQFPHTEFLRLAIPLITVKI